METKKINQNDAGASISKNLLKLLNEKGKSNTEISQILNVHPYRVKLALETDFAEEAADCGY